MAPTPAKRRKLEYDQGPATPSQQQQNEEDGSPVTATRRSSTRHRIPSAKAVEASLLVHTSRDSPTRSAQSREHVAPRTRQTIGGREGSVKKTAQSPNVRQSSRVASGSRDQQHALRETAGNATTPLRRLNRKGRLAQSRDELVAREPDELAESEKIGSGTPTRSVNGSARLSRGRSRASGEEQPPSDPEYSPRIEPKSLPLDRRKEEQFETVSEDEDMELGEIAVEAEPDGYDRQEQPQQDETQQPRDPRDESAQEASSKAYEPDEFFGCFKKAALSRLMQKLPIPLVNLAEERTKVQSLLVQTVAAGEGNSMLVIGARGSGKTTLVNSILDELIAEHTGSFHVIRLSGFLQTDDKLALREIWRQLGREMEVDDGDASQRGSNYADTLAKLLALLSHPDERQSSPGDDVGDPSSHNGRTVAAKSVVFIMDEFDLFATHPRQTLLYNLFDVAQSKKAPIAILGLTTRIDVTEALEKRVKSRFSHRHVHIGLPRSLEQLRAVCATAVCVDSGDAPTASTQSIAAWNAAVKSTLLDSKQARGSLKRIFATTRSVPEALTSLILPMSTFGSATKPAWPRLELTMLQAPESNLHVLPSLSTLQLALLIAAARLEIILSSGSLAAASGSTGGACNFNAAYAEYVDLVSRARLAGGGGHSGDGSGAASSSVSLASLGSACVGGRRVWSRAVALEAWQALCRAGLLVSPSYSGGLGILSSSSSLASSWHSHELLRCDVALEEIEAAVDAGRLFRGSDDESAAVLPMGLRRWCRSL